MNYVCTNCGEEVSREKFLSAKGLDCYCVTCSKLSKKQREKRAFEIFSEKLKNNA